MLYLSTVTPVYAGFPYLERLVLELNELRIDLAGTKNIRFKEAFFVIDGTSDGSYELLQKLSADYDWVRLVELSKNYGQHPATKAGVLLTDSDFVVTLDEDLQHRPLEVKKMLCCMVENKADIVYAHPIARIHKSYFRNFCSVAAKTILGYLAGNQSFTNFNSFRLMNGSIARSASSIKGVDVYFDIALSWFGGKITTVPIELVDIRINDGQLSNYSIRALFAHAKRMAISTNTKIPRFLAVLGFMSVSISTVLAVNIIYKKLFSDTLDQAAGWPSLSVMLLFFGGIITLMISFALEYISYITLTMMGKPNFSYIKRLPLDQLKDDMDLLNQSS